MQVKFTPYMSMSERKAVIRNHKDKVQIYQKLHDKGEKKPYNITQHHKIHGHMKQAIRVQQDAAKKRDRVRIVDRHDSTVMATGCCAASRTRCCGRRCCGGSEEEAGMTIEEVEAMHRRKEPQYVEEHFYTIQCSEICTLRNENVHTEI